MCVTFRPLCFFALAGGFFKPTPRAQPKSRRSGRRYFFCGGMGARQSISADEAPETCQQDALITHLPDDALCRCLATVPFRDRAVIARVCKNWRNAVASTSFAVARRELTEPLWLVGWSAPPFPSEVYSQRCVCVGGYYHFFNRLRLHAVGPRLHRKFWMRVRASGRNLAHSR